MKPVQVVFMVIMMVIAVVASFLLIQSVLINSVSAFFAAGMLLVIAGVFSLVEDKVRSKNG